MDDFSGGKSIVVHIIDGENYFQTTVSRAELEADGGIQLLEEQTSHTLTVVAPTDDNETVNVLAANPQLATNICTSIEQKETHHDKVLEEEVEHHQNDSSSEDDQPIASLLHKSSNNHCEIGYRDDYDTNKKYLLTRHRSKHSKDLCDNVRDIATTSKRGIDGNWTADTETHYNYDNETLNSINHTRRNEVIDVASNVDEIIRQIFSCEMCSYKSDKKYLFVRHQRSHSDARPYKCLICEGGFKCNESLVRHVNSHYRNKTKICKYCQVSFASTGVLIRHIRYKHTDDKRYKCTECDYACVEHSKRKRHMNFHMGKRHHQCPQCQYSSHVLFNLKRHLLKHSGEKPFRCDICDAAFTQSNALKLHKFSHDSCKEKVVYTCDICSVSKIRKANLREHIKRMHLSSQILKCKWCCETFSTRYCYKQHRSKECKLGGKKEGFKCQLCPFAATNFKSLKEHMKIHSTKVFHCNLCNEQFTTYYSLRRHQHKIHDRVVKEKAKKLLCEVCGLSYPYKSGLTRHQVLHKLSQIEQFMDTPYQ